MKKAVRILSGILALSAILFGIWLILILIGWPISPERLKELIEGMRRMPTVLFAIAFALLFGAAGIFVLYGMIREKSNRRTSALLEKNALGETAVSFSSLAQIAERAVKQRSDVSACKTKVYAIANSIRIDVRVVSSPAASLLELTHSLQDMINTAITEVCGKPVGLVDVTVDQADITPKKP